MYLEKTIQITIEELLNEVSDMLETLYLKYNQKFVMQYIEEYLNIFKNALNDNKKEDMLTEQELLILRNIKKYLKKGIIELTPQEYTKLKNRLLEAEKCKIEHNKAIGIIKDPKYLVSTSRTKERTKMNLKELNKIEKPRLYGKLKKLKEILNQIEMCSQIQNNSTISKIYKKK